MAGQVWATSSLGGYMSAQKLSSKLRYELRTTCRFRQFCDVKDASQQGKKKGDTFHWDVYSKAATAGGTLTETNTMPETNFTITQGTLTINEAGNSVPYTGKLEDLSEHELNTIVRQVMGRDAAEALDVLAEAQFNLCALRVVDTTATPGATIYQTVTTGTPTATNAAPIGKKHVGIIADMMKERNIPPYKGSDYYAIAWPSTFRQLKTDLQSVYQYTTEGLQDIRMGEIGKFENTRFVEQTNIPKDTTDVTYSNWAYFFGADTVAEGIARDTEIRAKIPTDYGRSKGIALNTAQLKPCELLESPNVKSRAISSQAAYAEGSTTIPQGSTPKWAEAHGSRQAGDIVSSAWKRAAVRYCN